MTNGLYAGGAEKVLQTLLNNLDYSLFDVTVYSMYKEPVNPEIITAYNKFKYKQVFTQYQGKSALIRKISGFFGKIKGKIFNCMPPGFFRFLYLREKYDIELAFIEGESTKIVSGSLNKKSKKLAWVHTDMIKNNWTDFLWSSVKKEAQAYKKFNTVVCVSNSVKDAFSEKYGISENVTVKYNPIDSVDVLKKSKDEVHIENVKKPLLITVGRLEQPKGYPRLLQCADRLHKEGYSFTLLILGDGKQKNQLKDYIEKNDLKGTVELLGFHNNPYKYIAVCDAFICSSYIEGFSTAAAESIILGKPVYTLDCPGMKELFGDENCGKIVPNTDEDLYLLLKSAVSDSSLMQDFTRGAERRADFFDVKKRVNDIENLLII